jgi:adenylylsulfate kinase
MDNKKATQIYWHYGDVNRIDREKQNGHRGFTLWFTGLSAAGKSTLAMATEKALFEKGCHTYVLDGDNIRHGLNANLGFSPADRCENIRRISEVAKLFTDCGIIALTAFISPYRKDRDNARRIFAEDDFIEIFVDCPLNICEERDPKSIYKKARAGMIKEFTGIDAPYEPPIDPQLHLLTNKMSVEGCVQKILTYLSKRDYVWNRLRLHRI